MKLNPCVHTNESLEYLSIYVAECHVDIYKCAMYKYICEAFS